MNEPAATAPSSAVIAEAMELLQPEMRDQAYTGANYIDVLGEQERIGPHFGQRVFRSKLVPPIYERLWRPAVARMIFGRRLKEDDERRITLEMLDISPGDRVLDVGCGPGNYTRCIAEAAGDGLVVGIDASEAMITAAVKRSGGAKLAFVRGDGGELPFVDSQFNAVCSVGVIHLLEDPMAALDEMVRVLAPGGRVTLGATCGVGKEVRVRGGVTVFGEDELTSAMAARGLTRIEHRVVKRGQIVAGRKSPE